MNQLDIVLIFYVLFFAYFSYLFYQIWFQPQKLINKSRNKYYKWPDWYPGKRLEITMASSDKGWVNLNRALSIFGAIFLIAILIILLVTRFTYG